MKLAICLPVYNEAECIVDYLEEVRTSFASVDFSFFLVNDSSTDLTLDTISRYRKEHSNVWVESNKINMGHGKTTLNAVLFALDSSPEMLLTVDGDGQVAGNSLRNLYEAFSGSNLNYGEGVRVERIDPWFRKLISFLTRVMVFLWAGTNTSDANTPIRIYTVEAAKKFWTPMISKDITIPNLYVSCAARRNRVEILTYEIAWRDRLGSSSVGSGWGKQRFKSLPSRKLIKVCINAFFLLLRESPVKLYRHTNFD